MKKFARAVKRRYGLTARRVAVRTHVAWYWRGLFMALALSCGIGVAWWMYDIGGHFSGFDHRATDQELVQLRDKLKQLETDNGRLRAAQVTTDRHSQIDSAAQQDTERALKVLQDENAQLKEELAFFRGVGSGDQVAGVNVYRFKVEHGEAGIYRYQLLLVQAGQREKVFQGRLQLVVTTQDGGKNNVRVFPANALARDKFMVSVKSYQKLEGDFQLPPASVVRSVEARIFGEGSSQPKLTKTVNLS
jgi:hypothetical protein